MKKLKRTISVLMTLVILLATSGVCFNVYAADTENSETVTFSLAKVSETVDTVVISVSLDSGSVVNYDGQLTAKDGYRLLKIEKSSDFKNYLVDCEDYFCALNPNNGKFSTVIISSQYFKGVLFNYIYNKPIGTAVLPSDFELNIDECGVKSGEKVTVNIINNITETSSDDVIYGTLTDSGVCGDNATWNYYEETDSLVIDGEGDMWDYNEIDKGELYNVVPWIDYNDSIKKIAVKKGITGIGNHAFDYCVNLKSVSISDSVTKIGDYAFRCCQSLTSVTLPESVTSIGADAFSSCSDLTKIIIPDSVTSIEKRAFAGCSSLTSITIPDGVTNIGNEEFAGCSNLEIVMIPDSVLSIDDCAFIFCSSLESIAIPDSVTNIGNEAFAGCSSLSSVTIGNSVTSIGDEAFAGCSSLTIITIPDSVASLGLETFYGCNSLTSVSIGNGVISIGSHAFSDCRSLTSITVNESNMYYCSDEYGVLYNKDKTELIQYPVGNIRESFNIPDSVISIRFCAFENCNGLTSITIPNNVKSIDYYAFSECNNLTSVTMPDSVTYIDYAAFSGCNSLEDVYYTGSEKEWQNIIIESENECLLNATIHYVEPEIVDITDEKTGIQVSVPGGTFDGDVTLKVEEVLSGSSFDIIGKVNGKSKTKVFTIETYVDGQSVQPNGDVTVRIPVPDGFNAEKCKLYYLNTSSKNPEEIAFRVEDGYIVFTTNHFSDWAIIQTADMPTVSVNDIGLNYKKSAALNPSVTVDENASYTVTYTSSNPSVARVDENGNVYGAKKGSTEITVTVTDEYGNTVSDTCKVNVTYAWWQWIIVIVLFGWIWY